jgi:hypothetical protein
MPYSKGQVDVATTPTAICSVGERGGVVIQNNGTAPVFLGGLNVAASGPNTGISLAGSGATIFIPSVGTELETLFGVVASGTQPVVFLFPSD